MVKKSQDRAVRVPGRIPGPVLPAVQAWLLPREQRRTLRQVRPVQLQQPRGHLRLRDGRVRVQARHGGAQLRAVRQGVLRQRPPGDGGRLHTLPVSRRRGVH